jgi:hypothetical protein
VTSVQVGQVALQHDPVNLGERGDTDALAEQREPGQRHGDQIGQLNSFLHAVRQHHWDDTLPGTALVFPEDYPARVERAPRALAEQVMAQIEHPDNLARFTNPAYRGGRPPGRARPRAASAATV